MAAAVAIAAAVAVGSLQRRDPETVKVTCAGADGTACASSAGGTLFEGLGNADASVQTSGMPGAGKGAFALRDFEKGERVSWCRCVVGKRLERDYEWMLSETESCDPEPVSAHARLQLPKLRPPWRGELNLPLPT